MNTLDSKGLQQWLDDNISPNHREYGFLKDLFTGKKLVDADAVVIRRDEAVAIFVVTALLLENMGSALEEHGSNADENSAFMGMIAKLEPLKAAIALTESQGKGAEQGRG